MDPEGPTPREGSGEAPSESSACDRCDTSRPGVEHPPSLTSTSTHNISKPAHKMADEGVSSVDIGTISDEAVQSSSDPLVKHREGGSCSTSLQHSDLNPDPCPIPESEAQSVTLVKQSDSSSAENVKKALEQSSETDSPALSETALPESRIQCVTSKLESKSTDTTAEQSSVTQSPCPVSPELERQGEGSNSNKRKFGERSSDQEIDPQSEAKLSDSTRKVSVSKTKRRKVGTTSSVGDQELRNVQSETVQNVGDRTVGKDSEVSKTETEAVGILNKKDGTRNVLGQDETIVETSPAEDSAESRSREKDSSVIAESYQEDTTSLAGHSGNGTSVAQPEASAGSVTCSYAVEEMDVGEPQGTVEGEEVDQYQLPNIEYNFNTIPTQVTGAWKEFEDRPQNFLKGCKWSPDGTCLLSNSNDNQLRLFNLPNQLWSRETEGLDEMSPVLKMREGDLIYDYCWYPRMSSMDPATCCLVSSCRDNPVHMWDAFTGELRCSYRAYDSTDEIVSAYSLAFSNTGQKIYCGYNDVVRIFDLNRPGRDCELRKTKVKSKKKIPTLSQRGILSCISVSPDDSMYAVGSYSKTVGVYCSTSGELLMLLDGQPGGVTHIKFSPDGHYLYSGGRKDHEILCWDIRYAGKRLFSLRRKVETNQRIYFDIDRSGRYLVSGNHDGTVSIWHIEAAQNMDSEIEPMLRFRTHTDTTNGISLHPYLPLLATGSGQQHYISRGFSDGESSDSDDEWNGEQNIDNSLRLWWLE